MKRLHEPATRDEVLRRLDAVAPDAPRLWGRMSAGQMLCHVAGALEMAMGLKTVAPKRTPLRFFPLNRLVIYVLPWPKGAPTAPELRVDHPADVAAERARAKALVTQFAERPVPREGPVHPAFGPLSGRDWSALQYRHLDHHLRQFGA